MQTGTSENLEFQKRLAQYLHGTFRNIKDPDEIIAVNAIMGCFEITAWAQIFKTYDFYFSHRRGSFRFDTKVKFCSLRAIKDFFSHYELVED